MALETAAQNYLRLCVAALSALTTSAELDGGWAGRSCADPALGLPTFNPAARAIASSIISLRPGTPEGFTVTVQGVAERAYMWPDNPTPFFPPVLKIMIGLAAFGLLLTLYL